MGTMEWLTAILAFITAIYAYLTHRMARVAEATLDDLREQTWNSSRPQILVEPYVRPNTSFLYLRISNVGKSTANDLTLRIDKEFWQFAEAKEDHALHLKRAFIEPIKAFHPGQSISFGLAQGWNIIGRGAKTKLCPSSFNVDASYSHMGRSISEQSLIDLTIYTGSEEEPNPLVEKLELLRKAVEKIR